MARTAGRHQWRAALIAGAVAATTLTSPQVAAAYTTQTAGVCTSMTWESPPQYIVQSTEFWTGGGTLDDLSGLFQALYDVNVQLNQIGRSSAEVLLTGYVNIDISAFEFGTWYNDAVPTLHIGFTSDPAVIPNGAIAASQIGPVDQATCTYDEAHIVFLDPDNQDWNYDTPQDTGEDFFTAGRNDTAGVPWFRQVYQHELIHTFGLAHSDDTYAFMNGNDRPWANRPGAESIRPLPDDVRGLRNLYPPAAGSPARSEVALLNSWFDAGNIASGAATQFQNCAPSLGAGDSADFFAAHCGVGGPDSGSTDVCPGDILRTRVSIANYSNREVNLTARIYLSLDDVYTNQDWISVTSRPVTVPAGHSDHLARSWVVPNPTTTDADYRVIARVTGTTNQGVAVEDWIPLTGTVHVQPANLC